MDAQGDEGSELSRARRARSCVAPDRPGTDNAAGFRISIARRSSRNAPHRSKQQHRPARAYRDGTAHASRDCVMLNDPNMELDDVLLTLGVTEPTDINVFESRTTASGLVYMARSADHPLRIRPISARIAGAARARRGLRRGQRRIRRKPRASFTRTRKPCVDARHRLGRRARRNHDERG